MRSGTYRGISDDLQLDLRVEVDSQDVPAILSGDIFVGQRFVASCLCKAPRRDAHRITGPLVFRGNPRLFTGSIAVEVDERGLGAFQIAVDLEGNHRDHIPGRLEWQGSFLRRLSIEIDGVAGQPFFDAYPSRTGEMISLEAAFAHAGIDADVRVDPFQEMSGSPDLRGYTYAELHRAMQARRDPSASLDRLPVHVFVSTFLAGRNNQNVLGVMYDFGVDDLNSRPREGVAVFGQHPLFSDPRVPEDVRRREFVYTMIHEVGHALNLLHSFDKGRPAALSWMNYPQLYPLGAEAGPNHDGAAEFWRRFQEGFDESELQHLRHATWREIAAGGLPFGVYEEGPSSIYEGGTADPRLTRLGGNPLRQAPGVLLQVRATTMPFGSAEVAQYQLGDPVFIQLRVSATSGLGVRIPNALDPNEGYTRIMIEHPNGKRVVYRPPLRLCARAQQLLIRPGAAFKESHAVPLFLGADGPVFTEPGNYRLWVELGGIDGSRVAFADPINIGIVTPALPMERLAQQMWNNPGALEALYLRHPLADLEAWREFEESVKRAGLDKKRTSKLWSYLNYVAALGWAQPFQEPGSREAEADMRKARDRLKAVDARDLPASAQARVKSMNDRPTRGDSQHHRPTVPARPPEQPALPPNGLFGKLGLNAPAASQVVVSPFQIVVRTHVDNPAFADIVTWNIQHLHGEKRHGRIPKIADFMLAFRCDFWALQEVGEDGVRELVEAMNLGGDLTYAYAIVRENPDEEAKGQQSACIYRTDTVRLRLMHAPGFFENSVDVKNKTGETKRRKVFLRPPLLCDVRVRQSSKRVFDFRCAIVHLKSTDPKLADKGDGMRKAAAKEIARWIEAERSSALEQDFLVMGDMNAETAAQGLAPFAKSSDLKLLSLGMKQKHGTGDDGAITRFSSKRLLDHIVVTEDTMALMPQSDEDEQIIVRSDLALEDFTNQLSGGPFAQFEYSDHLPVAVRFVLGKDRDP